MAQNYLWKVIYEYHYGTYSVAWEKRSKVFGNKIAAMKFVNQLENNSRYRNIRFKKWFG